MHPETKSFAFIEDKKAYVDFEDGREGHFDMSRCVVSEFFAALIKEAYFFERAVVQHGCCYVPWWSGRLQIGRRGAFWAQPLRRTEPRDIPGPRCSPTK